MTEFDENPFISEKNLFCSKCSYGHAQCSFENRVDKFLTQTRTFFRSRCRRLPPETAWSTLSITMGKTQSHGATLCPYLKTNIIKRPFNKPLDKTPTFLKLYSYIYIYVLIYKYIYDPMNNYVFECKIHTNSKVACITKKRSETILYSAQLICSLILKLDWSK